MESKFKVGDIVKFVYAGQSYVAKNGALAKIETISSRYLNVIWLNALANGQMNGNYYPMYFELADNSVPDSKADVGLNKDSGKLRIDLVPVSAIRAIAEVLGGACKPGPNGEKPKYPPNNWRQGIEYTRIYANIQRHLLKWYSGEDVDQESGLNHLKHALCRLSMLVEFEDKNMKKFDDRYSKNGK